MAPKASGDVSPPVGSPHATARRYLWLCQPPTWSAVACRSFDEATCRREEHASATFASIAPPHPVPFPGVGTRKGEPDKGTTKNPKRGHPTFREPEKGTSHISRILANAVLPRRKHGERWRSRALSGRWTTASGLRSGPGLHCPGCPIPKTASLNHRRFPTGVCGLGYRPHNAIVG